MSIYTSHEFGRTLVERKQTKEKHFSNSSLVNNDTKEKEIHWGEYHHTSMRLPEYQSKLDNMYTSKGLSIVHRSINSVFPIVQCKPSTWANIFLLLILYIFIDSWSKFPEEHVEVSRRKSAIHNPVQAFRRYTRVVLLLLVWKINVSEIE